MTQTKMLFASLIGAPNAGKSSLLNSLVGAPISIVTPKVQTTRTQLRGIAIVGDAQIVFVDTPGIFTPRKTFEKTIVQAAWSGMRDVDVHLLVIDARKGLCDNTRMIIETLAKHPPSSPVLLVLNKIDLVRRDSLLALATECHALYPFQRSFMVSATKEDGTADIARYLAEIATDSPWMYDPDTISDAPMRFLAAEMTREQCFLQLHQELPYALAVWTELWENKPDGSVVLHQVVYVKKDNQKEIVIGKGGERLKQINMNARRKISALLGCKVHLYLHVKVKEDWSDDPETFRI